MSLAFVLEGAVPSPLLLLIHGALLKHWGFRCLWREVYQEMGVGLLGWGEEATSILFWFFQHQCTYFLVIASWYFMSLY